MLTKVCYEEDLEGREGGLKVGRRKEGLSFGRLLLSRPALERATAE